MKYLIDTDVIISFLRGKRKVGDFLMGLDTKVELAASIITYGELEYGANKADDYASETEKVERLLNKAEIGVLGLTKKTMQVYGRTKRMLENRGEGLDDFDLLIGSTAVENEMVLVTDNGKHFARFPGLKVHAFEM